MNSSNEIHVDENPDSNELHLVGDPDNWDIRFSLPGGVEYIRITQNGDFYVKGNLVARDKDVYQHMRYFLCKGFGKRVSYPRNYNKILMRVLRTVVNWVYLLSSPLWILPSIIIRYTYDDDDRYNYVTGRLFISNWLHRLEHPNG